MKKRILFLLFTSLAGLLPVFALENTSPVLVPSNDSSDYSIKVDVNEVRLDAVVLDKKGKPMTDLQSEDFELFQDSQPQKILSCKYIPYLSEASSNIVKSAVDSPSSIPSAALARDAVQRSILFLIHNRDLDPPMLDQARKVLQRFVETQMQPHDSVAIIQDRDGAVLQAFTSNKPELLARIRNLSRDPSFNLSSDPSYVVDASLIEEFWIDALGDMPGRKFLILLPGYRLTQRATQKALYAGVVIHGIGRADGNLEKTGGIMLPSWNFGKTGLSEILQAMNGYYLITYAPPQPAFTSNEFHSIKIKVKRSGSNVLTRAGFWGVRQDKTTEPSIDPLFKALFSSFRRNDLKLTLAAGYIANESKGNYEIRSWLNLDGHDIGFKKDNNKKYSLSILASGTTAEAASIAQTLQKRRFDITVNEEEMIAIMENGLRISIPLTATKPGSYYVRAAAQDAATGAIGSAYQFIEIPKFKNDLAMSSIFLVTPTEDLSWISPSLSNDSSRQSMPAYSINPKNQASRSFKPGESLETVAVIYNAKNNKEKTPSLESSYSLYRNKQEIYKSKPEEIAVPNANKNILLKKKIILSDSLEPGEYVLRIEVKDTLADEKKNLASQTLQFEIIEK